MKNVTLKYLAYTWTSFTLIPWYILSRYLSRIDYPPYWINSGNCFHYGLPAKILAFYAPEVVFGIVLICVTVLLLFKKIAMSVRQFLCYWFLSIAFMVLLYFGQTLATFGLIGETAMALILLQDYLNSPTEKSGHANVIAHLKWWLIMREVRRYRAH